MMIPYEELDKHFIAPKSLNTPSFHYKKFPRKLKKKLKNAPHKSKNLNEVLWFLADENYKRFIIKKLCEIYEKNNNTKN